MESENVGRRRTAGRVPQVWGKIPPRNKNFTGRQGMLDNLHKGLTNRVTAVIPQALHGMGGVGKTQVVIEYAHRFQAEYDLVWWISADQPDLVPSSLAGLAPRLGLESAQAAGIEDSAAAVLDALRRGDPYDRWLLIFDNAGDPESILRLVPADGPGHVLVTSRNQEWESVVDTVAVDVFTRSESIEFLNRRAPRSISETDARMLAESLGDLPLALEQAGALQSVTGMAPDEYLDLLSKQPTELLNQIRASEYPASMTAAWQLSVSRLEQQLPEAMQLLRACAFFGPEPIPLDVFRRNTFTGESALNPVLGNAIRRSQAIRMLGRFALVRIDSDSRTIQVHRLIQALLRESLPADEQREFRLEVQRLLAGAAPANPDNETDWPRYAELVPHVRPARIAESADPRVRRFATNIVRYLTTYGDLANARAFVEEFLETWQADSDPDAREIIVAKRRLGTILRELGEYRLAYDLVRDTLAQARRVLGPEDETTVGLINGFGADLRARGEFAEALRHDETSRDLHRSVYGERDGRTLATVNNLALDYALLSDYKTARDLHEAAFNAQSEASTGVSKSNVLSSWNGLARVVRLCGDYVEARFLGEDAYDFGRQELSAENLWTLRTGKDLSIAMRRAGAYDDALDLAQDIFTKCNRQLGADRPDTLAAAMCLSNILRTIGRIDDALTLAQDTVDRYPKVYGEDHPYNMGCLGNLALLYRVRGRAEEARALNERALAGLHAQLGKDHHYPLTVAINLASDRHALGEFDSARELGADSLARLKTVLGEEHPVTLGCAANLVVDLRAAGADEEAEALAAATILGYNRTLGPEHPDTQVAAIGNRLDFDFDAPPI
ncbi:FxSxx-COOH system tetratricopeptide repeat protein [Actinoallomurus sp. NPDC052308]|uniref:FxSxx-COOH system tetratricopeptide repeat protein n=1 Tax=Actinoallomurus sp. NPDC052308 TaxID=3155530 RepID=UPI0034187E76